MTEGKRLLVIGNGFDLHHGMKTRYDDFLMFVKAYIKDKDSVFSEYNISLAYMQLFEGVEKNNFVKFLVEYSEQINGWIDFEIVIKNIIQYLGKFIENELQKNKGEIDFVVMDKSGFADLVVDKFDKFFYFDEDCGYKFTKGYQSNLYGVDKDEIIKGLRREFDEFRGYLKWYLMYIELYLRDKEVTDGCKPFNQIKDIGAEYIITFNYTDTYNLYDIPKENVTHIHGELEKEIVLGYDDVDEDSLDYVFFKKYFQCIKYGTDLLTKCENGYMTNYQGSRIPPKIYFFGHSLDETDEEYLNKLLGYSRYSEIHVFYLDDTDYERKVINLIKLLGKEEAVKAINSKRIQFVQIEKEI